MLCERAATAFARLTPDCPWDVDTDQTASLVLVTSDAHDGVPEQYVLSRNGLSALEALPAAAGLHAVRHVLRRFEPGAYRSATHALDA